MTEKRLGIVFIFIHVYLRRKQGKILLSEFASMSKNDVRMSIFFVKIGKVSLYIQ